MKQSKKSKDATHTCKICFKPIKVNSLVSFVEDTTICRTCYESLRPKFIRFKVLGYRALSLYFYDDKIRSLLYQFKGTLDYELKSVFITFPVLLLRFYFHGYYIIPAPSSDEVDKQRGFNQVVEMFKSLRLPYIRALRKNTMHFQHEGNAKKRKTVSKVIEWNGDFNLKGKKILLVDDVYTTGSTVKACIKLIEKHHPKNIKILTMAKTIDLTDR